MGRFKFIVPVLLWLVYGTQAIPRVDPLVDSKVGLIKGLRSSDGSYSMFLGIPYATVDPQNPFGQSIPHAGFEGTFEAYDDSAVCPQREEFNNTLVGTLDCLHLNIFVPSTASSRQPLPVLVWIHGGGFQIGFNKRYYHGPQFLVRHDVIVVTLNYRLGPYGFLCLDTPEIPGNQGLKDQLTALRWVKENIAAFGGDSSKITISGESAGGASVDLQLIYTNEDLFSAAILQSGTASALWSVPKSDPDAALKLAEHLGFITNNLDDALGFLKTVDTDLIIAATEEIGLNPYPCVEKEFDNVERFITDQPVNMEVQNARKVSIMIGFNSDEGWSFVGNTFEDPASLNLFSELETYFNFESDYLAEMKEIVRHFYIGDEDVNEDVKSKIANYFSDFSFIHPTCRSIEKYMENGATEIYQYLFSYVGGRNFVTVKNNITSASGAVHADELGYLFGIEIFTESPSAEDQIMIDKVTTLWTNFVKFRNPTPETTDLLPVKWPAVTKDVNYYLNIDSELSVKKRYFADRMAFWDLFFKLNKGFLRAVRDD